MFATHRNTIREPIPFREPQVNKLFVLFILYYLYYL